MPTVGYIALARPAGDTCRQSWTAAERAVSELIMNDTTAGYKMVMHESHKFVVKSRKYSFTLLCTFIVHGHRLYSIHFSVRWRKSASILCTHTHARTDTRVENVKPMLTAQSKDLGI